MKLTIKIPASSGHDHRVVHETLYGTRQAVLRDTVDGAGLLLAPGRASLAILSNGDMVITAHFDHEGIPSLIALITESGTCELSQAPTGHLTPIRSEWVTVERCPRLRRDT